MASAAKRRKNEDGTVPSAQLTMHFDLENKNSDCELGMFLKWCGDMGIDVNHKVSLWQSCSKHHHHPVKCHCHTQVRDGKEGSCSRYGMVATVDIAEGETLFAIPRDALLHPGNCSISSLLQQGEIELRSGSGWVPLVVCLMYEYTQANSKWRPYLDLCPDYSQLDSPMFWDKETVTSELKGTGVPDLVDRDVENIRHEYHSIAVPFMEKNPEYFDLSIHTLDLYRKLVAFVMAYSFSAPKKTSDSPQEDGEDDENDEEDEDIDDDEDEAGTTLTMMVPMADILNHVAKNNARLQFGQTRLSMVATKDIKKDEEVFNTYGELPNWQLLQMYGFVEQYPENIYDTVDLPLTHVKDQSGCGVDGEHAQSKWDYLKETEEILDDSIVISCDGILNKWETYRILKILSMTPAEFKKHQESCANDDGLEEEEEDDEIEDNLEELFSFDGLSALPAAWRQLLTECANKHLKSYKNTMDEDIKLVQMEESGPSTLNSRQRYACYLRIGQRKLLEKVVQFCRIK
ncbi:N-lysine methyltransferase setd6-like [Patiria miniata]|uniref:N-lysine methyltransferase n=1 Tax=Patiria miniata TaxID=46514 RepID=A0A914A7Q1_PATMI|nr:N-lysine methyltransferase setd6-like [Patiria miniata]